MISFFSFLKPPPSTQKAKPKNTTFVLLFLLCVFGIGDVEVWFAFFSLRKKKTRFFFCKNRKIKTHFNAIKIHSKNTNK